jgi:branched-chain amino acid transport system ATP-binding protein
MLEVTDLSASYGPVQALAGVSLQVKPGEIVAVLGANGAGKTTLLRTISGLHRPDRGAITLDDRNLVGTPAHRMTRLGLTHVPEGRGVIAELTAEENVRLGALGRSSGTPSRPPTYVLQLFPELEKRWTAPASVLSGGERQMLVIARAMVARPSMLLLDEPSLGLAPRIISHIFATIRRLVDEEGLGVLLVEQNARSALSVADRGVILNLGRVVAEDRSAVMASDSDLRHSYLGF